jgi:uncharacterized integral membrane protein
MKLRRRREAREETWQTGLYLKLLVLLLVIAYAVAFVIENHRDIPVHFVFHTTKVSLIWVILLSLAIGVLGGVLISQLYRRRRRKERGEPAEAVGDLVGGNEAKGEPEGTPSSARAGEEEVRALDEGDADRLRSDE